MIRRPDRHKSFFNGYLFTSIGTIIVTALVWYYISNKAKTYKEIPYDIPIIDKDFYGRTKRINWHKVDIGKFSIETPISYLYTRLEGFDSTVGQISNQNDTIFFDYGRYSNPLEDLRNDKRFESNTVKINGRQFLIIRNSEGIGTIGAFTKDLPDNNKLSITCHSCDNIENIIEMFKTIEFRE